jgi:hypothetical protein
MNFVVTRKLIGGSSPLAGCEWYYDVFGTGPEFSN